MPRVACQEMRLLELGHVDLRVSTEHPVKRGGTALGMADDEEVGHPAARSPRSPKLGKGRFAGRFRFVSHRASPRLFTSTLAPPFARLAPDALQLALHPHA